MYEYSTFNVPETAFALQRPVITTAKHSLWWQFYFYAKCGPP